MWNFFRRSTGTVRTPLTPAEARSAGSTFLYRREWQCACGAQLRIRTREERADGPSNFHPYPAGHKLAGHSRLPANELTWAGLAVERGWRVEPVRCPACQQGLTASDYRVARRQGAL